MKSVLITFVMLLAQNGFSQEVLDNTETAEPVAVENSESNFEAQDSELNVPEIKTVDLMVGVSLKDLSTYSKGANIPNLELIGASLEKAKQKFVPAGEKIKTYHGAFLQELPLISGSNVQLRVLTLATTQKNRLFVSLVTLKSSGKSAPLRLVSMTPVNTTRFTGDVGLIDRKVIFTDLENQLRITIPIGVGSFDEGVLNPGRTSLLTPRFKKAALTASATISQRHKPNYFAGKPFIRIVDGVTEDNTAIGFHIEINDSFQRSFDSHGCMRMREQDLMMIHDLVKFGQNRIDLTISYDTQALVDHPAPKMKAFKTVLNVGNKENPDIIIDRDNLVQIVRASSKLTAPVDQLIDREEDHYYSIFQYEGMDTYKKQRAEQAAICKVEYDSQRIIRGNQLRSRGSERQLKSLENELLKNLEECKRKGERKMGFKDKLYRAWVH